MKAAVTRDTIKGTSVLTAIYVQLLIIVCLPGNGMATGPPCVEVLRRRTDPIFCRPTPLMLTEVLDVCISLEATWPVTVDCATEI